MLSSSSDLEFSFSNPGSDLELSFSNPALFEFQVWIKPGIQKLNSRSTLKSPKLCAWLKYSSRLTKYPADYRKKVKCAHFRRFQLKVSVENLTFRFRQLRLKKLSIYSFIYFRRSKNPWPHLKNRFHSMKISWITNPKLMVISVTTLESYNAIFRDFY